MTRVLLAGLGLAGLAASASAAPGRSALATCDERPGQTLARNDRWRIFIAAERGGIELSDSNPIVGCGRASVPSRELLALGSGSQRVSLAGDLVQLGAGRYGNSFSIVVDLATRRRAGVEDSDEREQPAGTLLPGGALVWRPLAALTIGLSSPSPLALADRAGSRELSATAVGLVAFGGRASGETPGFYYVTGDGQVHREVPQGPVRVDDLAAVPAGSLSTVGVQRGTVRVRRTPGTTTTYVGIYDVHERRAGRGRPAALTVRFPNAETLGPNAEESDLVARLAPGSRADLQLLPGAGFIARFADRPRQRQLRLGKRALSIAGRLADDAWASGATADVIVRHAGKVTLFARDPHDGRLARQTVPIPPGAKDFAIIAAPGSPYSGPELQRWLLYTDPAGAPQRYAYKPSR